MIVAKNSPKFYIIISCMFCSGFCGIVAQLSLFTLSESLIGGTTTDLLYTMGVMMFFMGIGALIVSTRIFSVITYEKFIIIELLISLFSMYSIPCIFFLVSENPDWVVFYFVFFSAVIGALIGMEIPLIQKILEQDFKLDVRFNSSFVMMMDYFGSIVAFFLFSKVFLVLCGLPLSAFIGGAVNLFIGLIMIITFFDRIKKRFFVPVICAGAIFLSFLYYFKVHDFIDNTKQKLFRHEIIWHKQTPYQELILTDNSRQGSKGYEKVFSKRMDREYKFVEKLNLDYSVGRNIEFLKEEFKTIPSMILVNMIDFFEGLEQFKKLTRNPNETDIDYVFKNFNQLLAFSELIPAIEKLKELVSKDEQFLWVKNEIQKTLRDKPNDLFELKSLNRIALEHCFKPWFQLKPLVKKLSLKKSKENHYSLFINGGLQFDTYDEYKYHEFLVHTPMHLLKKCKNVLIMGGGDGMALREVNKYKNIEKIKLVDIDPIMTKIFIDHPIFSKLNNHSFSDPRVEVLNIDAFQFAREDKEKYDLIILDFPDPHHSQTAKLYSVEMFEMLRRLLEPEGVLISQSSSPIFDNYSFMCIRKTFEKAGFAVTSHHIEMVTFLQWGFQICSASLSKEEIENQLRNFKEPIATRWLNQEVVRGSLLWDKEFWKPYPKLPYNSFLNLALMVLYEKDNFYLDYYLKGKIGFPKP